MRKSLGFQIEFVNELSSLKRCKLSISAQKPESFISFLRNQSTKWHFELNAMFFSRTHVLFSFWSQNSAYKFQLYPQKMFKKRNNCVILLNWSLVNHLLASIFTIYSKSKKIYLKCYVYTPLQIVCHR